MAKANPIRFSTKYDDDESDLLYYGYRCYKPSATVTMILPSLWVLFVFGIGLLSFFITRWRNYTQKDELLIKVAEAVDKSVSRQDDNNG